jgi:abhydrolase domain-containing protein 6
MIGMDLFWIYLGAIGALFWIFFITWPKPLARAAQAFERHQGHLRSKSEHINGITWHYLEGGHGEPLVLLHGFNGDAYHFTRCARHLSQHFRIIAPDLPGFGETTAGIEVSHRIEDIAKRLLEWLDHHQIEQFYLGGNSMGGYISTAMARQAPSRVKALWLLAPGGIRSAPLSPVLQEVSEDRHNPLVVRNHADFERLMNYCFVNRPWAPTPLLRFLSARAAQTCQRSLRIFDAMLSDSAPLETIADGLDTPALIVWGQQDKVLDAGGGEILCRLMPHSQLILMPLIGHLPMLEAPRQTAEAWLAFTETLARNCMVGKTEQSA